MSMTQYVSNDMTRSAMKAELLDAETELALARAWRDDRDEAALHRLTTAYMRLAISMAMKFKRYGAVPDLIQEASIGLMKAADKFDPDRGVRFSTYAVWWIKASIQDHVMRNWSLVRTGSTSSQKSLFFNLKRVEAQIERQARGANETLDRHQVIERIATEIGVSVADAQMMHGRMSSGDYSLNAQQGGDEDGREWIETLEDETPEGADRVVKDLDHSTMRGWLAQAMKPLNERERRILMARKYSETSQTLSQLGEEFGISKERVRQLEAAALGKMRNALAPHATAIQQLIG